MIDINRLLRLSEVLRRVGLAQSTWYELMARGRAPRPVVLGTRCVMWVPEDVEQWIAARSPDVRTNWRGEKRTFEAKASTG